MATRKTTSPTSSGHGPAAAPSQATPADSLGVRLKHARMVRQLTLKALAEQAGCSESLLSKVEGGHATPSLATLHKLALALSTNIAALVSGPDINTSPVQRANERPSVSFPTKGKRGSIMLERVVVPSPGQLLQGDIHVIEPHSSSDEQISHLGEELGYVIEGELELTLDDERYLLKTGDSFYFPSSRPHSYRNPGKVVARVLWINTPPTF
ncbi:transcriptional regulator, XRE family with cupin sensor [Paraburkholderia fungorum]|uniref:Transcriptional regulator, XRE family with cupin sensor n=2 Tax=Burkholderiaceae TaxID=119060 RepID=A0A1H1JHA6_9BURK|nr:transcriptional regulator, XRE family with cupin sensor [Paraburkholderia fungorum]